MEAKLELRKLMTDMAEIDLMLQARVSLDQFTEYYQKNEVQLRKDFCQPFAQLFKKGRVLQDQGKKPAIAFLAISVLRSFILNHCYQLRLDLYDNSYFLDPVECSIYLDLEYLLKYIDTDIDAFIGSLKECGAKYTTYEVDRIKKDYIEVYASFAQDYILEQLSDILALKEFAVLQKTDDFKIIYGEYLDRTEVIYPAVSESGEN